MKTLLTILSLIACSLAAQAQTITNIAWRVTVETVTAGVTNSTATNFRWDASVKKDALKVDGVAYYFGQYMAGGGTGTLGQWLRTDTNDRARAYADAKQAVDNAALLAKLQSLLLLNPDLLTAGDLSSLNTIAAKAP